jgi:hypothetical protein
MCTHPSHVLFPHHRDQAVKYHIHDVVVWEQSWVMRKQIQGLEEQLETEIPQAGC